MSYMDYCFNDDAGQHCCVIALWLWTKLKRLNTSLIKQLYDSQTVKLPFWVVCTKPLWLCQCCKMCDWWGQATVCAWHMFSFCVLPMCMKGSEREKEGMMKVWMMGCSVTKWTHLLQSTHKATDRTKCPPYCCSVSRKKTSGKQERERERRKEREQAAGNKNLNSNEKNESHNLMHPKCRELHVCINV